MTLHVLMAQKLRAAGFTLPDQARALSIEARDLVLNVAAWSGIEDEAWEKALELLDRGPIPIVERADVHLREWMPNREEGDVGVMYVLDVLGLNIIVHENEDVVYVHIDSNDAVTEASRPGLSIAVEVNNSGETIHGR